MEMAEWDVARIHLGGTVDRPGRSLWGDTLFSRLGMHAAPGEAATDRLIQLGRSFGTALLGCDPHTIQLTHIMWARQRQ